MIKGAAWLFGGGLLSKVVALPREVLIAGLFGTGTAVGAYRIAQTATLIPVNFFTAESLSSVFIPLYMRYRTEDPAKADTLFWSLFGIFALLSVVLTAVLWAGAGFWVGLLAPGFDTEAAAITGSMLRLMAMSIAFYLLGALLAFLEMANGGFVLAAARPTVQSLGMIGGALAAWWTGRVELMAAGFAVAYGLFFGWALHLTWRAGYLNRPRSGSCTAATEVLAAFWSTLRYLLLLPILMQGNIALERIVASLMGIGVVAAVDYARFIGDTGVVLLAVPLGYAGLIAFSGMDARATRSKLEQLIPLVLLMGAVATSILMAHGDAVVRVLFARGAFDQDSVATTSAVLLGLSHGIWAQVLGYVLVKVLNAQLRNTEVLLVLGMSLAVHAATNLLLYRWLGPLTLGLGVSVYGIGMTLLAARALRVLRLVLADVALLAPGVLLYLLLIQVLAPPLHALAEIAVATCFSAVFWLAYLAVVAPLRRRVVPLVLVLRKRVS